MSRAGHSLLETLIVVSVFPLLIGSCFVALTSDEKDTDVLTDRSELLRRAERALTIVTGDLERTGWVTQAGVDYPFFVAADDVSDPALTHHHPQAVPAPDGVTAREVVFLLPRDADGDGWPDVDESFSAIDWDPTEVAFVLVPDADGSNVLERREAGGTTRRLASRVRRFLVEDSAAAGFAFPLGNLRVTIELESPAVGDRQQTLTLTRFVNVPNGEDFDA